MIMTEENAAKKWCPMTRIGHVSGCTVNDPTLPELQGRCIASDCAMWRWAGMREIPGTSSTGGGMNDEAHGYCGLAGLPGGAA